MQRRQRRGTSVNTTNFVSGGFANNTPTKPTAEAPSPSPIVKVDSSPLSSVVPPPPQIPPRQLLQTSQKDDELSNSENNVEMNAPNHLNPFEGSADDDDTLENGKKNFRKFFSGINKKPSVRAKERRIRQNRRLRKVLIPKNALMALHEVKGIKLTEFLINSRVEGGFSAKVSVNNMQYEGIGNSKISAKNNACEKALRDHVIFKMLQTPIKAESENGTETTPLQAEDVEMKETENDLSAATEEDEVPMLNLASFALFKLFSEWESEGFEIPEFRPHNATNGVAPATPPVIVKRSELPPNWETMHPTSLLCMMRPGITYSYLGGEGSPPNTKQRVGVSVDGENFLGEARSRKLARRNAAVDACNNIFNTSFAKDI